ncbi:MAG: succinylglutamate desuccinylase, partial [Halobacteriaceae archaeon]
QSFSEPFGLVKRINQQVKTICTRLSITSLVETGNIVEGRLFATTPSTIIEIEAGKQGSDKAAENAYRILREFLTATNAIPGETISRTLPIYRLEYELPKPSGKNYTTSVTNFEKVSPGDIYASADGTEYVADDEFYPILVSPYGYENKFGYAGSHQGEIEPEQNTRLSN